MDCPIYSKHKNIINGIYMDRNPISWKNIPLIDNIDAEDEDGELFALFKDVKIYDIEQLSGFTNPIDMHNIQETIFIIRRNGNYYLCETQGENYVKFSTNITKVDFVQIYDRLEKIKKVKENLNS
jgi:hypothetical protein